MSTKGSFSFPKREKLCSQKLIDALYAEGYRLTVYPYSVRWRLCPDGLLPEGVRVQALIATSKKKFHHAVDRNRVKRLSRECYRHAKPSLTTFLASRGLSLTLALNYIHNDIFPYAVLSAKMEKVVQSLTNEIERHAGE